MTDYDNRNTFVLFQNDKEGNDKRPDYKGTMVNADGQEQKIAAWIRKSKTGKKFMSGKIDMEGAPAAKKAPATIQEAFGQGNGAAGYEDNIPFAPVRGLML